MVVSRIIIVIVNITRMVILMKMFLKLSLRNIFDEIWSEKNAYRMVGLYCIIIYNYCCAVWCEKGGRFYGHCSRDRQYICPVFEINHSKVSFFWKDNKYENLRSLKNPSFCKKNYAFQILNCPGGIRPGRGYDGTTHGKYFVLLD